MEAVYQDKLDQICERKGYAEIIDAVLGIPEEERDYQELAPYLRKYLIYGVMHGSFEAKDSVGEEEDCLIIPGWKVAVTPQIGQITHRSVVLDIYLYFPEWGKEIYECSAGMGTDLKQAFGMASGSFMFSMMDGLGAMASKDRPKLLETRFAGKDHRFQVYLSNIVGMGNTPRTAPDVYWKMLKEDIRKRLGNQAFCFVKVYGAKADGQVTGECRIDDVKSEELSAKVADFVKDWEDSPFASHKQFFFICQDEDTIQPYPYFGREGRERFAKAVTRAVRMFHESNTQELYDTLGQRLAEEIGDETLAQECCTFLPELCARNAFPEITYGETLEIVREGKEPVVCYQSQLADYWQMWDVFSGIFHDGTFGEESEGIYQEYIAASSIFGVVKQMRENQANLSGCRLTSLLCRVGENFVIR